MPGCFRRAKTVRRKSLCYYQLHPSRLCIPTRPIARGFVITDLHRATCIPPEMADCLERKNPVHGTWPGKRNGEQNRFRAPATCPATRPAYIGTQKRQNTPSLAAAIAERPWAARLCRVLPDPGCLPMPTNCQVLPGTVRSRRALPRASASRLAKLERAQKQDVHRSSRIPKLVPVEEVRDHKWFQSRNGSSGLRLTDINGSSHL